MGDGQGAGAGGGRGGRTTDLAVAVRRIVVGYRVVSAGWLALLVGAAWAGGTVGAGAAALFVALAAGWALLTAGVAAALPEARTAVRRAFAAADTAVGVALVVLPAVLTPGAEPFAGGYPLSAVVVAAWLLGMPGALAAAGLLAGATAVRGVLESGAPTGVLTNVVFYVIGAAVLAWGLEVLRRTGEERDAAEAALVAANAERARAEERAATAAHLHDSVLQTLALIQRRSDDPTEVVTLARGQERGLRDWLAGRTPVPGAAAAARPAATFAAALAAAVAEVEAVHHLAVEVVTVGDAALDEPLAAAVAAAREALVNAAKHAGVPNVDLYAEIEPGGLALYVRDRGRGFAPDGVPDDRRGLAGSVVGRMRAVGGEAVVRSAPGRGTEVELRLPRVGPGSVG